MVGKISHELARYEIDLLLIADDEQAETQLYAHGAEPAGRCADRRAYLDDDPRLTQLLSSGFPSSPLAAAACRSPTPGLISIIRPEPIAPPAT
jgi:LacI family transcriptional regulator